MALIKYLLVLLVFNNCFATNLFDYELTTYKSETIKLKDQNIKAYLVVNIATRCGYTGQLDDLEALYQKYKAHGLLIVGIPSNDFGGQSPENNEDIVKFCKLNYGATFPITLKQHLVGTEKSELYKFITSKAGSEIKWNFEKVLFNKEGNFITKFPSSVEPGDSKLAKEIETLIH